MGGVVEGGGNTCLIHFLVAPASASAMSLLLSKPILQEAGPAGMFSAGGMSRIN